MAQAQAELRGVMGVGTLPRKRARQRFRPSSLAPKGPAVCVVCLHPECEAIEQDFINAGGKYGAVTAIMRKYGIKHSASLYEHARATGLDAKRA